MKEDLLGRARVDQNLDDLKIVFDNGPIQH